MWVPTTEADIRTALETNVLVEGPALDAKAALPAAGKNKDLARDICAMTVDGGVLLYGVGGVDPTRPDELMPFDRAGVAERIDQVAQAAIAEPAVVEIVDVASDEQSGLGYLVVVVPASPRAPHMVTLEKDHRYYGRGATGNRVLTEGEVGRLYDRRGRWQVDRGRLLDEVVDAFPFSPDKDWSRVGPMVVTARPVATSTGLLKRAAGDSGIEQLLRDELRSVAGASDPYPGQGTRGLERAHVLRRKGSDVYVLESGDHEPSAPYQAYAEITLAGAMTYWHSPVISSSARNGGEALWIMEQSVTRAVHQVLAYSYEMCKRAGYAGAVDIAVAVLAIREATGASLLRSFEAVPYGADDFRQHERLTVREMADPAIVTARILEPLYDVISVRDYDPYAESRKR